jgi:integrase/recombinase XerD
MRHKRKGGLIAADDGFDRSHSQTLACLGDAWLEHMLERNYSPRSVEGDRWCLRAFLHWTQERDLNRADQITKPVLETYQRWLYRCQTVRDQPLSVTTQRRYLNTVQKFFAWLCRNNTIAANPACDLELPRKKHQLLPRALSKDEVWLLLAQPDISDPLGVRDRTILELLYSTGLRRTELIRLDVDDIEAERGVLLVRQGKGGGSCRWENGRWPGSSATATRCARSWKYRRAYGRCSSPATATGSVAATSATGCGGSSPTSA